MKLVILDIDAPAVSAYLGSGCIARGAGDMLTPPNAEER
jgi:hypothetical protein